VRSVLGRYLEHSRIYYFRNADSEEVYLGSADLMQRNLNHRVEVLFPVESTTHIRYLRDHVLKSYFKDHTQTRIMQPDGTYKRLHAKEGDTVVGVQDWLMSHAGGNGA
jgi:polyphosphate kinase